MKILVVQESDWIKRGPHNSHHFFERLSERGHEIRVIDYEINWADNSNHPKYSKRSEINNYHKIRDDASITIIRPPILYIKPFNYLSLLYTHKKEIIKQIKEFNPDVVIGFGILNAYIAVNECKKNNISFVYFAIDTLHTLVHEKLFQNIAKYVERRNYLQADLVISVNKLLRDYTIKMGASANKSILLPHGIELFRFADASNEITNVRNRFGFRDEDTVVFFMGYLYDFSGLITVANHLKDNISKYPNIKLLIVGEGPLYDELCSISDKIQNNMVVLNWQPYTDIPSLISACDVCILPSEINDIMKNIVPIKILEYMAAGNPVITTRLDGIIAEFGNDNGITYVDKPEEVINKSFFYAENDVLELEGEKARSFVQNRDWDILADEFEGILEKMI